MEGRQVHVAFMYTLTEKHPPPSFKVSFLGYLPSESVAEKGTGGWNVF